MSKTSASLDALTIAAVERETGLAKDTLRVWERRYGFPKPERDAKGERIYPPEQVDRLRLIRRLLDQGGRPAQIVRASREELHALLEGGREPATDPQREAREQALLALVTPGRSGELRTALQQLLLKQGLQRFVADTIAPLNETVGKAWLKGDIDVAQEHLYTELVQNMVRGAIGAHAAAGGSPRILLTTFPDELHGLGLLMAEATLVPEGATCVSLGTQTPLAEIRKAGASGFDVVGVSFSTAYPMRAALDGLRELRAALPADIEIWAGGGGMRARHKAVPGVRVITELSGALTALEAWRAAHR